MKRHRPLAAGTLSIRTGLHWAVILLLTGLLLAFSLQKNFFALLLAYVAITTAYSLYLKRVPFVDVLCLASLYGFRVIAGHLLSGVKFSYWLMTFCICLFLSFAFVKRYSELHRVRLAGGNRLEGRSYLQTDLFLIKLSGITSGLLAVLVFALYIGSESARELYSHREALWPICPLLLFWIGSFWVVAGRGKMNVDPVVHALSDRKSYGVAGLIAALLYLAT